MTVSRSIQLIAVAVMSAGLLWAPSQANAAFKVQVLENGVDVYDAVDNGAGDTGAGTILGTINFTFSDSNLSINVTTALSKPSVGGAGQSIIDVGGSVTFAKATQVEIRVTDTGFDATNGYVGAGALSVRASNNLASTFTGYLDNGNKEFGGIIGSADYSVSTSTPPGVNTNSVEATGNAPYSLSADTMFTGTAGGFSSWDNMVTFAPAPNGLILALCAMPVLGLAAWLRRRHGRQALPMAV
jgi:hypothetical protein